MSWIILAAGVVGLSCALAVGTARAAGCPAVAIVQGPIEIVDSVRAILRAHDIATDVAATAPGDCPDPGVRVTLVKEPGSSRYLLHIEDPFGRKSDRHVSDAETAASLIESWALPATDDLAPPPPPPSASTRASAPHMVKDAVASGAWADQTRWRMTGALELTGGSDSSIWYGGALTGCGPIAAFCIGGRMRIARDDDLTGPDRDVSRTATELLLLGALPLTGGRFVLTPMLGLGLGWVHTGAARPDDDAANPSADDLGLRVEAAASAGVALSQHVSLIGEIGASLGWSMASTVRERVGNSAVKVPFGFLRTAIACQYSP